MSTVTCPNCRSQNTEGSKFCNRCGYALPPSTHITCPNCKTRNPRNLLYCDNCGTRLSVTGELSHRREEEKEPEAEPRVPQAFSLPTREPGDELEDELDSDRLLDWLRTGEEQGEGGADDTAAPDPGEQAAVVDDWLNELSELEPDESDSGEAPPEWFAEEGDDGDDEDIPDFSDWFIEGEEGAEEAGLMDWLSELEGDDADQSGQAETVSDWLSEFDGELETAEVEPDDSLGAADETLITSPAAEQGEEELPDWLDDFGEEPIEEAPTFIETTPEVTGEGEEIPDWLSDFGDEGAETVIESSPETGASEEIPDWLSDFGDEGTQSVVEPSPEMDDSEEIPDWLSDFGDEETETAEAEEALPDWLDESRDEGETPTLVGATEDAGGEDDFADWLDDIDDEPDSTAFEGVPAEGAVLPDWLSDLGADVAEPATDDGEEMEDLPDWLSGFDSDEEGSDSADRTEDEILPDWLSEAEEGEEAEEAAVDDGDDDWLADFQLETPPEAEAVETTSAGDSFDDWLDDFEGEGPALTDAEAREAADEDFADWLSDLDVEREASDAAFLAGETAEAETLPDWVDDFDEVGETADEAVLEEEAAVEMEEPFFAETDFEESGEADEVEEGDFPDWLSEMPSYDTKILSSQEDEELEEEDLFAEMRASELAPMGEMPDWLSDVAPAAEEGEPEAVVEDETADSADDGMPDWLSDFPDDVDLPDDDEDTDWLAALTQEEWPEVAEEADISAQIEEIEEEPAPQPGPSQELKGVPKELASSDLPDWLQDDLPPGSELFEDEGEVYFGDEEGELVQGEIPDWLQQMKPTAEQEQAGAGIDDDMFSAETGEEWEGFLEGMPKRDPAAGGDASALRAGEIPAWLQALKPQDIGKIDEEEPEIDEPPETEGPLAGLRGVLPVAPIITEPVAATAPVKYTISKEQQQQISLLHQLTHEDEAKTKLVVQKKASSFSAVWRVVLGLLLFLVVIGGVLLPRTDIGLPETALPVPQSALDAYNTIDPMSGRSVLVAFDYTPAMAGELDPMGLMLLRQLAANGNRVVTISQSAAGTAIAERLVGEVNDIDSRALPLLPGEAVGLRSLGACLETAETCDSLYDSGNTELMADLSDVGLVIVLTSDRNSLINWIEQVERQNEMPVIAAVTQPLGPLTIPYLSSGQLEGSLNGIPAASAYEKRLLGQDGSAFTQFRAQTIVMWAVIVALAAAALFYGLTGVVRGDNKGNG